MTRDPIEPLSRAAREQFKKRRNAEDDGFADCEAFVRLKRELGRYLDGQVNGRSILIAGHRGSGKTTLVKRAVQQLTFDETFEAKGCLPLLVPLEGQRLVLTLKNQEEITVSDEKFSGLISDRVLVEATRSLYHSLRSLVLEHINSEINDPRQDDQPRQSDDSPSGIWKILSRMNPKWILVRHLNRQRKRLAATLPLELDQPREFLEIEDLWKAFGANWRGIFFKDKSSRGAASAQGSKEIAAFAAVSKAYSKVCFTETKEHEVVRQSAKTTEVASKFAARLQTKEFLSLAALLIVLAGLWIDPSSWFTKFAAPSILILAGSLGLVVTGRRSLDRNERQKFVSNDSMLELERSLPDVIRRIESAGVYPVFMIDELDKVSRVEQVLDSIVNNLKTFVSENAFFCFIVGRDYYELVEARVKGGLFPREHTIYNERLFLTFHPHELAEYVNKEISSRLKSESGNQGERITISIELICRYIIFRARLNIGDVRKLLRGLAIESIRPSEYGGQQRLVLVQVALELALLSDNADEKWREDPWLLQQLIGALYYPFEELQGHEWLVSDGSPCQVNLEPAAIRTALEERAKKSGFSENPLFAVDQIVRVLKKFSRIISDEVHFRGELEKLSGRTDRAANSLRDLMPHVLMTIEDSAIAKWNQPNLEWQIDSYGKRRDKIRHQGDSWSDFPNEIELFEEELLAVSVDLTYLEKVGVLFQNPAINAVRPRIRTASKLHEIENKELGKELDEEFKDVLDFERNLTRRKQILSRALAIALYLQRIVDGEFIPHKFKSSLKLVAEITNLESYTASGCPELLQSFVDSANLEALAKSLDDRELPDWIDLIKSGTASAEGLSQRQLESHNLAAWMACAKRLKKHIKPAGLQVGTSWSELVTACTTVAHKPPIQLMLPSLARLTPGDWCQIFLQLIRLRGTGSGPSWTKNLDIDGYVTTVAIATLHSIGIPGSSAISFLRSRLNITVSREDEEFFQELGWQSGSGDSIGLLIVVTDRSGGQTGAWRRMENIVIINVQVEEGSRGPSIAQQIAIWSQLQGVEPFGQGAVKVLVDISDVDNRKRTATEVGKLESVDMRELVTSERLSDRGFELFADSLQDVLGKW